MDPVSKRTFIVTGGNSGIGLETARLLADMGARVVIMVRDASRGQMAVADIRSTSNHTDLVADARPRLAGRCAPCSGSDR